MRGVFTWLVVFCIVAGLGARVLAADAGHLELCETSTACCHPPHEAVAPAEHPHDGEDCPLEHHHHHGCCFQPVALTLDSALTYRLGVPGSALLADRHKGEVTPEGPFLGSEKPPLI